MKHFHYIARELRERWHNRARLDRNAWHAYGAIGLLLLLALLAGGCKEASSERPEPRNVRFEVKGNPHYEIFFSIITDTKTGRQYLLVQDYYGPAITPLIDSIKH